MPTVSLSSFGGVGAQFFDNNGNVLSGGKIYTYAAGTTTPLATYTSNSGSAFHTNPIILDAAGRVPSGGEIWLTLGVGYKFVLRTSADVLIATYDNIPSSAQPPSANDADSIMYEQGYTVTAGSFVVGKIYRIVSVGTTNFTLIGATSNTVGAHFIATGAGTGTGTAELSQTVETKLRQTVSVKDFGAVGDGVTDDTAAIQAAINYCNTSGAILMGAPGDYRVTSTLVMNCNGNMGEMTILANATLVSPVIVYGGSTSTTYDFNKSMVFPQVENTGRVPGFWGTGTGIEIRNTDACIFTVPRIEYFENGLRCGGLSEGCAYNTIFLQYIYQNKINVLCQPKDTIGWCTQNVFIGGRLGFSPSQFVSSGYTGSCNIAMRQFNPNSGIQGGINHCTFINVSLESDVVEFMIDCQGNYNQFQNMRYEGLGTKRIRYYSSAVQGTTDNLVIGGTQNESVVYVFAGSGTSEFNQHIASRKNVYEGSGALFAVNTGGFGEPHWQGFNPGVQLLNKDTASTDWTYRFYAGQSEYKQSTDAHPRLRLGHSFGVLAFGDGTISPNAFFQGNGSYLFATATTAFAPSTNGTIKLGDASYKWSEVFASNGTINTSDARQKQQVRDLSESERNVAVRCKSLIRAFKWNDAVDAKGDGARIHFGVMAQDVRDAFTAEGLDADKYGLFCYDEWEHSPAVVDTETGQVLRPELQAGNAFGIRYDELLAFIISAI
jgi:hypothetical protein